MKAFKINPGAKVLVHENNRRSYAYDVFEHTMRRELLFFLEDIVIDPVGSVGTTRYSRTIGGCYARAGYYGFLYKEWTVLVKAMDVEVR